MVIWFGRSFSHVIWRNCTAPWIVKLHVNFMVVHYFALFWVCLPLVEFLEVSVCSPGSSHCFTQICICWDLLWDQCFLACRIISPIDLGILYVFFNVVVTHLGRRLHWLALSLLVLLIFEKRLGNKVSPLDLQSNQICLNPRTKKLSQSKDCKSCQMLWLFLKRHLPKTLFEI
jgi:hypothetical protein